MNRHTRGTVKGVLCILGAAILLSMTFKACDTSVAVGENATIIPGECVIINYDATEAEFDAVKAAWLEALKEHPAKGTGHTKVYY